MNDENAMIGKEYFNILKDVKETIRQSQNKAMVYVNSTMILNYYKIEFMQQPAAKMPWYTLVEIMYKSKSHDEMILFSCPHFVDNLLCYLNLNIIILFFILSYSCLQIDDKIRI